MDEPPAQPESLGANDKSPGMESQRQDLASKWSAMAEFDASEADLAQVQTRPVDTVRAEEEELLGNKRVTRNSRGRGHSFPASDRLATGGIMKPKLSPEELAQKMEAMKLKNQRLVERRARSEADESQYREQEEARQIARKEQKIKMKQKQEDDNRMQREIDNQREEVRRKKLGKALEWDQDKPTLEDDDKLPPSERFYENYDRGSRGSGRGFGRDTGRGSARGRGFGGRRGRGRGFNNASRFESEDEPPPSVSQEPEEWPSLQPTEGPTQEEPSTM